VGTHKAVVPCEIPTNLNHPRLSILAVLTKAIHQGEAVRIHYRSIETGPCQREIVPFVPVGSGLRWHVSAYCREHRVFTDFVITRITEPKLIEDELREYETREADIQ